MPAEKAKTFNFEKSIKELEKLVDQLETGELSLENSLKHFEKGIKLTRECQDALKKAEQKVQVLIEKNGQELLVELDEENENDE